MKKIIFLMTFVLITALWVLSQGVSSTALTERELVDLLKKKTAAERIIADVRNRGVGFDLNPEIEKQLRKAKATDELIEAVRGSGPTAKAQQLASQSGAQISPVEVSDFGALQNELDPDRAIQLPRILRPSIPTAPC